MADDSTGVYVSDYYKYQGSTKLSEATKEYDNKKTKKKKSFGEVLGAAYSGVTSTINKAKSAVASVKNAVNDTIESVKSGLEEAKKSLTDQLTEFQKKYNLTTLLEKVGLGADNPLMQALSDKFGLSPSILDNWATDLASGITSFAEDFVSDINPLQMAGIFKSFTDFNLYDKVMLNTVVKPLSKIPNLGFIGSGEGQLNYMNELLRVCLSYDLSETLEYLDDFNNTTYTSRNTMYRRGNYAAKLGCCTVARYICKQLYKEYKENTTGTKKDNPSKAFTSKQMIVSIFKDVLVYGYSNFTVPEFNRFIDECKDVLDDFSYYGTTDSTFNGKYCIDGNDIDIIAPIVTMDYDRYIKKDVENSNFFKDPGLDYDTYNSGSDDWSLNKRYIDIRNSFMKTIYIKMAKDPDVPTVKRLVNKELHKRLSKDTLTTFQKANKTVIKTMASNNTGKSIFSAINSIANGGLTDSLGLYTILQKLQAKVLKTPEAVFGKTSSNTFLNLTQLGEDVGKFNSYEIEDKTLTQEDIEKEIRLYAEDAFNNILPTAYKELNASITDFMVINTSGLTNSEIQTEINKLNSINPSYVSTDTFRMMRLNNSTKSYSIINDFLLYSLKKNEYLNNTSLTDRETIQLYSLAYYMVVNYASKYSLEALCAMYGEDKVSITYKTNSYGDNVLDSNGNPIVLSTSTSPEANKELAKILKSLIDTIKKIVNYCKSIVSGKKFRVHFDNMGIGENITDISNISAYSILGSKNKPTLTDPNKNYVFIGWTENISLENILDFDNTYITEDTTLYAVWKEADYYVTYAKLTKENNSTLTEDVVATIDNANNYIIFPIKTSEKTDGNRFIISLDISDGANSDVNTGYIVVLGKDKEGSSIKVYNTYGNYRTYFIKYVEVNNNYKRIAYISKTANLYSFKDSELSFDPSNSKSIAVTLNKSGYTFKGWYYNETFNGHIVESIDTTKEDTFIILYPYLVEDTYSITYKDKYGTSFSGKHGEEYPTKTSFRSSVKLDTPSRDNYVFTGYHRNYQCTDEIVTILPKFSVSKDITLYADWMDSESYQIKYGTFLLNGLEFKLTDLIFYTKYILENKTKLIVTSSGLNLYSLNGTKLRKINIDGTFVLPLGVAHIPDIETFFVATRNIKTGKRAVYYSTDEGLSWNFLTNIKDADLKFFVGTGYQTLDNIKFFYSLIYQSFILEIKNNSVSVNDTVLYDSNNVPGWDDDLKLVGIAVTIDKSLYLLFNDSDIIQITNVDIKQNSDLSIIKPNKEDIEGYIITGTSDTSKYEIDTTNIGSAYNNTRYDNDVNDDFDINDESSIISVLSNNKEDRITVYTYRNAGRLRYVPTENGGNTIVYDESKSDMWDWQSEEDGLVLKLANYDTKGLYTPSILKPIEEVSLSRNDTDTLTIPENRKQWSDDLVADKSEVEEVDGVKVYKGHGTITPSNDYTSYSDTDIAGVDYVAMAEESQNTLAEEYLNKYPSEPMTDDKTGKITYGELTKDFYEYITGGYKKDNTLQEKVKHDKEGSE